MHLGRAWICKTDVDIVGEQRVAEAVGPVHELSSVRLADDFGAGSG
jgi:hypothetical protein